MEIARPPRLRGVQKDDLSAIAELEATAFGANGLTRSALDVIFDPFGPLWLLAHDKRGVWGHAVNSRDTDPHVGWILGMAVHPRRQRRGWGRYLLQASIDRLRDNDVNVIRLLVKPTNKIARHLYEEFEFKDTGERVDHFGPGQDRLVMSLLLPLEKPTRPEASPPFPQVPVEDAGWPQNGAVVGPQVPGNRDYPPYS